MPKVQFVDDGSGERVLNHKILDQKHAQDKFQNFLNSYIKAMLLKPLSDWFTRSKASFVERAT